MVPKTLHTKLLNPTEGISTNIQIGAVLGASHTSRKNLSLIIVTIKIITNANKRIDAQLRFLVLLIHNDLQFRSLQFMVISDTDRW